MPDKLLSDFTVADGIPQLVAGTIANATDFLNGVVTDNKGTHAVTSADVNKLYVLLTDGTRWFLTTSTPVLFTRADTAPEAAGTAPPTTGTYALGARVWNSAPIEGSPVGWVCVGAGTPGTWRPMAAVQGTSPTYTGKYRVVIAALGESGMAGAVAYDYASAPADWPSIDGGVSIYSASRVRTLPTESVSDQGTAPVEGVFPQAAQTWIDRGAQLIQQRLAGIYGAGNVEVCVVLCAKTGTTSLDWAVGGALYNAAVARIKAALLQPGAVLGGIFLDQGLNDASPDLWDANWTVIETALRADLGGTQVPLYYRHQQTQDQSVAVLRNAQTRWQKSTIPKRLMFESPSTGFANNLHLGGSGLQSEAGVAAALEAANPIVPSPPAVTLSNPTRAQVLALTSVLELYDMSNAGSGASWAGLKNGYALTQGTTGKQPVLTPNAGNGRPAWRLTAASQQFWLMAAGLYGQFAAGQKFGCIAAFRGLTSTAPYNVLVSLGNTGAGNDGVHLLVSDTSGAYGQGQLLRSSAVGPTFQSASMVARALKLGVPHVFGAAYNNGVGTTRFRVQTGLVGKVVGDNNAVSVASPNTGRVGCFVTGASELYYFDGYLSGLCFFDGAASESDIETMCTYLTTIAP